MSESGDDRPPPDVGGEDRPSENEDQINDLDDDFAHPSSKHAADDDSDDESLLSEVDEAQFADFDASAVQVAPDFDALKSIKVSKRKRPEGEEVPKKKKLNTR
jgi:transcription factor SPN1